MAPSVSMEDWRAFRRVMCERWLAATPPCAARVRASCEVRGL